MPTAGEYRRKINDNDKNGNKFNHASLRLLKQRTQNSKGAEKNNDQSLTCHEEERQTVVEGRKINTKNKTKQSELNDTGGGTIMKMIDRFRNEPPTPRAKRDVPEQLFWWKNFVDYNRDSKPRTVLNRERRYIAQEQCKDQEAYSASEIIELNHQADEIIAKYSMFEHDDDVDDIIDRYQISKSKSNDDLNDTWNSNMLSPSYFDSIPSEDDIATIYRVEPCGSEILDDLSIERDSSFDSTISNIRIYLDQATTPCEDAGTSPMSNQSVLSDHIPSMIQVSTTTQTSIIGVEFEPVSVNETLEYSNLDESELIYFESQRTEQPVVATARSKQQPIAMRAKNGSEVNASLDADVSQNTIATLTKNDLEIDDSVDSDVKQKPLKTRMENTSEIDASDSANVNQNPMAKSMKNNSEIQNSVNADVNQKSIAVHMKTDPEIENPVDADLKQKSIAMHMKTDSAIDVSVDTELNQNPIEMQKKSTPKMTTFVDTIPMKRETEVALHPPLKVAIQKPNNDTEISKKASEVASAETKSFQSGDKLDPVFCNSPVIIDMAQTDRSQTHPRDPFARFTTVYPKQNETLLKTEKPTNDPVVPIANLEDIESPRIALEHTFKHVNDHAASALELRMETPRDPSGLLEAFADVTSGLQLFHPSEFSECRDNTLEVVENTQSESAECDHKAQLHAVQASPLSAVRSSRSQSPLYRDAMNPVANDSEASISSKSPTSPEHLAIPIHLQDEVKESPMSATLQSPTSLASPLDADVASANEDLRRIPSTDPNEEDETMCALSVNHAMAIPVVESLVTNVSVLGPESLTTPLSHSIIESENSKREISPLSDQACSTSRNTETEDELEVFFSGVSQNGSPESPLVESAPIASTNTLFDPLEDLNVEEGSPRVNAGVSFTSPSETIVTTGSITSPWHSEGSTWPVETSQSPHSGENEFLESSHEQASWNLLIPPTILPAYATVDSPQNNPSISIVEIPRIDTKSVWLDPANKSHTLSSPDNASTVLQASPVRWSSSDTMDICVEENQSAGNADFFDDESSMSQDDAVGNCLTSPMSYRQEYPSRTKYTTDKPSPPARDTPPFGQDLTGFVSPSSRLSAFEPDLLVVPSKENDDALSPKDKPFSDTHIAPFLREIDQTRNAATSTTDLIKPEVLRESIEIQVKEPPMVEKVDSISTFLTEKLARLREELQALESAEQRLMQPKRS